MNLYHKGNIIINDNFQFAPKSLTVNYESLASDNSGRTLDGTMHIFWVFNKIRKLEIELIPTTPDVIAQIFSRVQGQIYNITYWDLIENREKTIEVYTSNSHADCYSGRVKNGLYQGAKFNAIEIAGENSSRVYVKSSISSTGDLEIQVDNSNTTFTRSGNDLIVDDEDENIDYSIVGKDLWSYES